MLKRNIDGLTVIVDLGRGSRFPGIDPVLRRCETGFYRLIIGRPDLIEHERCDSALNAFPVGDKQIRHPAREGFRN